jgi:hypothetical protein
MVAVKTGLAPPPMMPQQPMNMMPPPMPVPALNQPMPMQQGAAPVPVNARRRKRFGDSLETMLSRPPMVASDQMGDMNVFTGQMMNTAARRPVVQQMRGGGNVRQMYRDAYSSPAFAAAQSAASQRNPGRTGAMTHSQLMDKIRGGSSPNDDKPAPVVVTRDDDYTPTSAELNQQLANQGLTDMRSDTSVVPDFDMIRSGSDIMNPDRRDAFNQDLIDRSARNAAINMRFAGGFDDVELPRGTGGLSSPSIPSGTSSTLAQNMITFPESPDTSMQPGPAYSPSGMPNTGMTAGPAYLPLEAPLSAANINLPEDVANALSNLGLGDPNATQVGSGRGNPDNISSGGQTGTGSGEEDDRTFVQKLVDDVKAVPGNIMRDLRMGIDAGFYTDFEVARDRLLKKGYDPKEVQSWIDRTKATIERNKQQTQGQSTDDDSPMSASVVDPCPEGFKLDPASGICVPIEEAEEEGPSLDLNRTRDDEFNELDDIMNRIVKPVGDTDEVRTMQAGGSVGLNRVADNFLAAMGG